MAAVFAILLLSTAASAQEVEPRRWGHLPMRANFAGSGYAHTRGDVFFDPVLQIEDVELEMDTYAIKYIRTFEVFGKSARLDLAQAYHQAEWSGLLEGEPARAYRSGWSDPVVRFSVNLLGAPPLEGKEFAEYRAATEKETIVGVALAVHLPLGEYIDDRLLNLGANRFTIRPQFGAVHVRGKWSFEATGAVRFYTSNDDFFDGSRYEKDPLYALQSHVAYTYRPGIWIAAGGAYGYGGEATVERVAQNNETQDVWWGLAAGYPITRRVGAKIGYIGRRTQQSVGLDSDSFLVAVSGLW